jgi:RimJ/RimL family protein N-acetyltransferase
VSLGTERLTIRPWRVEEAPRLFDMMSRMEVVRYLGDGGPVLMTDVEEARTRIERINGRERVPPTGFWAVEVRATGTVAGSVMLVPLPHGDGELEVAWHLHPDSWGHGYATEAADAVLRHGFAHGLTEVYAVTHVPNVRSQAVCRRLGMEDLGIDPPVAQRWYAVAARIFRSTPRTLPARP